MLAFTRTASPLTLAIILTRPEIYTLNNKYMCINDSVTKRYSEPFKLKV